MRLWIGPDGERIDLDGMDISHSMAVVRDAVLYGLDPDPLDRHWAEVEAGDADLDFDTVIVLAEMTGWVRVSRDAAKGALAVSASSEKHARRGLASVVGDGLPGPVQLEIEALGGGVIERCFRNLDAEEALAFLDKGRLSPARSYATPVAVTALLEALPSPAPVP